MLTRQVATFSDWSAADDPHGEHDLEVAGHTFFAKIDCYDEQLRFGSADPSDPVKTTPVLTLMLVEGY